MSNSTSHQSRFLHYGWVIVAVGALVLFSCLGLARYAYTMLLPAMQTGLQLSYDRMGLIGTANFSGYLVAVVLSPWLLRRFRPRAVISAGLLLIALCMAGISQSRGFLTAALLYAFTGLGGGLANIPLMALVPCWFRSRVRGRAAGLIIGGNGLAIICAGYLIPLLNRQYAAAGWRLAWLLLAAITLLTALIAALWLRNTPAEKGLEPLGPLQPEQHGSLPVHHEQQGDGVLLLRLGLLYLAFGATFMVFGTFIVTSMVRESGFSEAQAGHYWSWVGFFSVFSGVGFGSLSDRIGRKQGLALVFLVQSTAYLLAGLKLGSIGLMLAIVLYGSAVFAIPAIMAAAVGDYLGTARAAASFATITIFFAVGQTIGPAVAGLLARSYGSFAPAYLCAAAITCSAALFSLVLPTPHRRDPA